MLRASVLAALVLSAPCGMALVVQELSFDELVTRATGIYEGRIVDKRTAWNEERTLILTHYTLEVGQTLKGIPTARVSFSELGGEIDGLALEVEGVPRYELGEEAVVFFHAEKGRVMTLNWYHGKFPVSRARGGEKTVAQAPPQTAIPLDEFTRRVEEVLRAQGGQP